MGTEKNWGSGLAGVPRAGDQSLSGAERGGVKAASPDSEPCGQLPPAEVITRPTSQSSVGLTERLALAAIFAAMLTTRGIRPASEARRSTADRQGVLRFSPYRPVTVSEGRRWIVWLCGGGLLGAGCGGRVTAVDGNGL